MKYIIQTEHLRLREFELSDYTFIIELVNGRDWLKFIGDKNVKTKEEAENYLSNGPIKSYSENGFGLYLVENRKDKKAIGMCGIIKRDNLDCPDIGFALLPDSTGKGFGYEIAKAMLEYAIKVLHIPVIYAITIPENKKSIMVLKKIGLGLKQSIIFPGATEELLLFSTI